MGEMSEQKKIQRARDTLKWVVTYAVLGYLVLIICLYEVYPPLK